MCACVRMCACVHNCMDSGVRVPEFTKRFFLALSVWPWPSYCICASLPFSVKWANKVSTVALLWERAGWCSKALRTVHGLDGSFIGLYLGRHPCTGVETARGQGLHRFFQNGTWIIKNGTWGNKYSPNEWTDLGVGKRSVCTTLQYFFKCDDTVHERVFDKLHHCS